MPDIAHVLAALADPTRRAVLEQLRGGALTVGEIAARLPVTRPAVSQHLRALQAGGLVRDEWRGTRHFFSLDAAALVELRRYAERMWQDAMLAYGKHVDQQEGKPARSRRR